MPTGYRGGALNPQLSALWLVDRSQAREICMRALRYHEGNVTLAARELVVAKSTLTRWISDDPALKTGVEVIRGEARAAAARIAAAKLEPD